MSTSKINRPSGVDRADLDLPTTPCERRKRQQAAYRAVAARLPSAPLFEAAARFEIDLVHLLEPAAPFPGDMFAQRIRPVVILISDDAFWAQQSIGPDGWRCAPELHRWAEGFVIGGSRGDPEHYPRSSIFAQILWRVAFGRVAFVETSPPFVDRWIAFIQPRSFMNYQPRKGVHVVPAAVRQ